MTQYFIMSMCKEKKKKKLPWEIYLWQTLATTFWLHKSQKILNPYLPNIFMEEQALDPYYHQSIHFSWAIPSSDNKNKIKKPNW